MRPEIKNMNGVVNSIVNAKNQNFALVSITTFTGANETLVISKEIALQYIGTIGKLCSISYEECRAGITTYVDPDDPTGSEIFHETDHKRLKSITVHNPISLLLACRAEGLSDLYQDLLNLQNAE